MKSLVIKSWKTTLLSILDLLLMMSFLVTKRNNIILVDNSRLFQIDITFINT